MKPAVRERLRPWLLSVGRDVQSEWELSATFL
jgi:hypothetical protein